MREHTSIRKRQTMKGKGLRKKKTAYSKRPRKLSVLLAASGVAVVVFVSITFATAVAGSSAGDTSVFGLSRLSSSAALDSTSEAAINDSPLNDSTMVTADVKLTSATERDAKAGIDEIAAEEEAARIAAEEAARAEEQRHIEQAEENKIVYEDKGGSTSATNAVDFSVGKEAFIAEWTSRIDAYLSGSNLAGQGKTFAEAAWEYGVDPRWSPAISNTESGKGYSCFLPYNAWGWGQSSWSSWEEAIWAHVQGLANGYGYTISLSAAKRYCPPAYEDWYAKTLAEMNQI